MLKRIAPKTYKQAIARGLVQAAIGTALSGAALVIMSQTVASPIDATPVAPNQSVMDGRDNAEGSPADLMDRHDCWNGEAPADMQDVIPGHVVIRYDGDVAATYRGERAVGDALEFIFDDADNGVVEVVGFCR